MFFKYILKPPLAVNPSPSGSSFFIARNLPFILDCRARRALPLLKSASGLRHHPVPQHNGRQEVPLNRSHALWPGLLALLLILPACASHQEEPATATEVSTAARGLTTVAPERGDMPSLTADSVDLLEEPADWSLRDRALAFKPALQALQSYYDDAVHLLAQGNLLTAQERIDQAMAELATVQADSELATGGLASLYLTSLQNRLDRLQEIFDEESLMHFSAPLAVADDSLVALWYGGLADIPARPLRIERNARIDKWIDQFNGRGREVFQNWINRGEAYRPIIEAGLARYELPPELYYLAMIESGFKLKAVSSAGAVGPWQFIRGTAHRYGLTVDYWVDERRDVVRATEAACQYLSHLYGIFQDWNLAMAAYNSGEFRVMSAMRRAGSRDYWQLDLPRETEDYVPTMMAAAWIGSHLEDYGFTVEPEPAFVYEDLEIAQAVDLSVIAKKGNVKRADLEALNPHILRWCTPPDRQGYALHVPPGRGEALRTALAVQEPEELRLSFAKHKVRRGDTLFEIAKGYGTTVQAIIDRNGIRNPRNLRAGMTLVIPTHPDRAWREPAPNGVAASAAKVLPPLKAEDGQAKSFYTVRRGDNLSSIAGRLGVPLRSLQRWNNFGRSSRIYPGQVLQYLAAGPRGSGGAQAKADNPPARRIHVVSRGETLSSISRRYGTTIERILGWNEKLSARSVLHPGDRLVLYTDS